jgi:hypothetical protein
MTPLHFIALAALAYILLEMVTAFTKRNSSVKYQDIARNEQAIALFAEARHKIVLAMIDSTAHHHSEILLRLYQVNTAMMRNRDYKALSFYLQHIIHDLEVDTVIKMQFLNEFHSASPDVKNIVLLTSTALLKVKDTIAYPLHWKLRYFLLRTTVNILDLLIQKIEFLEHYLSHLQSLKDEVREYETKQKIANEGKHLGQLLAEYAA